MKNLWSDAAAKAMVRSLSKKGVSEDIALRVYSARLLGSDKRLVLCGGGNASVKTEVKDLTGEVVQALFVKGSGHDMSGIEADGFAAVRLEPLLRLANLCSLSGLEMNNARRCHLLDCRHPDPSVEFLLHAFLPAKFCDHAHPDAVLAVTNQADGGKLAREVYQGRAGVVSYLKPGFGLAKEALAVYRNDPSVKALVLVKHGIFTFGDSAKESYGRMIEMVSLAEKRLAKGRRKVFAPASIPKKLAPLPEVAPILRGLCARGGNDKDSRPMILDFRSNPLVLAYVNGKDLMRYSQIGAVTPDHAIRTRVRPLAAPAAKAGLLDDFRQEALAIFKRYREETRKSLARHHSSGGGVDLNPRVILAPGLGLFGLGESARDAAAAADLAENTIRIVMDAESIGTYQSAPEADLIEMELWPPERAKLGSKLGLEAPKPLAGQIVAITGGGSGIGAATAMAFAKEGAGVAVLDLDLKKAKAIAARLGETTLARACDVTRADSVKSAFDAVCETFGGVDIVVSNAGAAWQGAIGDVDERLLRQSFELNFFGHQNVAQAAVRIMRAQGTGGCLLFNISKQAVNPGKGFGPYGLPKAAAMFLVRQYALDHGADGIRTGGVNADRIRSGLLTGEMIAARSKARGLSQKEYMAGNLLGREVTADDVADAFVYLAKAKAATACILTVDGGNIAAALR